MNSNDYIYKGLSNTVNVYYEVPFNYSIGFALSPVLPGLSNLEQKTANSPLGDEIMLTTYGLEVKYHFGQFFIRPGVGYAYLKSDEGNRRDGKFTYLGFGYEFQLKHFGLALELAQRETELNNGTDISTYTPNIGFHFYKYL